MILKFIVIATVATMYCTVLARCTTCFEVCTIIVLALPTVVCSTITITIAHFLLHITVTHGDT